MADSKRSSVWTYFEESSSTSATCRVCNKVFKRSQGNTSNLTAHLKRDHQQQHQELVEEESRKKVESEALKQVSRPTRKITAVTSAN